MKRIFLILVLSIPKLVFAEQETIGMEPFGFETINPQKYSEIKTEIEIKNIPPIMFQNTLGICYAFAASTILTAEYCKATNNKDCNHISSDQIFSPLALASYGIIRNKTLGNSNDFDSGIPGGSIANSLQAATYTYAGAASDSCFSLEKILSKINNSGGDHKYALQLKSWKRLRELYNNFKTLPKNCDKCTTDFYANAQKEIENTFAIKLSNKRLIRSFSTDHYDSFFYAILEPEECRNPLTNLRLPNEDNLEVNVYPPVDTKGNYKEAIENIKKVLNQGRLLGIGSLCLDKNPTENNCQFKHGATISGYRRVCNKSNSNDCKDVIKVINSWGEAWQKEHDDGWIDAKKILDRSFYGEVTLSWLSDNK